MKCHKCGDEDASSYFGHAKGWLCGVCKAELCIAVRQRWRRMRGFDVAVGLELVARQCQYQRAEI